MSQNRVYVGDGTRVQFSDNDGQAWALVGQTFGGEVTEIAVAPQRPITQTFSTLLVGTTAGVYRSTDGGATFTGPTGPASVVNFTFDRAYTQGSNHSVFAAVEGAAGGFFRSIDPSDGATWQGPMNTGLPAANPGITAVGHQGGNVIYAGSGAGNLNGVYRSGDLGQTWSLPSQLTSLTSLVTGFAFAIVGGTEVAFASTRGGVLRSSNQGLSWTGYSGGLPNTRCGALRLSYINGQLRLLVATEGRGVYFGFIL